MPEESLQIEPTIQKRRSAFIFSDEREIDRQQILALFEAARWAPSSGNRQPWRYILFDHQNREALRLAQNCLSTNNQIWANSAPVLILAIAEETRPDGKHNKKALHDLGLANQNLLLQATAMGLLCHPMGGFAGEKAIKIFHIPEGYIPVVMIAIGYPGDKTLFPSEIQEQEDQPRKRHPISDFVFQGNWVTPLSE